MEDETHSGLERKVFTGKRKRSTLHNYNWVGNPKTEELLKNCVIKHGCSWKKIWDEYFTSDYPDLTADKLKNHWNTMVRGMCF